MGLLKWVETTATDVRERPTSAVLRHAAHTLYLGALRRLSPLYPAGENFWARDWEVLVILDACRPDLMREACASVDYAWLPPPDDIETVRSPGSTSHEWMEAHFSSKHKHEMRETAYVTANLFIQNYAYETFADFCQLTAESVNGLDVTPPRPLTDRAIDIWRRREERDVERLVVHYMQPHTPFRSRPEWFQEVEARTGWGSGFVRLRDGEIGRQEFWDAYLDNLLWVLEDIDVLLTNCEADAVISSDHGNGLGEWGIYGHPNGIPFDTVREVPWIPVRGHDHGTHSPRLPDDYLDDCQVLSDSELSSRLEALGYA